MGHNAIHDAGALLQLLADHEPAEVEVDGLVYREGLNAVAISGGIAGNVIPDRCRIEINYRFAPDKSAADAEAYVRGVLPGFELEVTDVAIGARPGLDQPAAAEFLAALGAEASAKFGWTDVARFAEMGIPAVNFGPGNPSKAHADDEFCPAARGLPLPRRPARLAGLTGCGRAAPTTLGQVSEEVDQAGPVGRRRPSDRARGDRRARFFQGPVMRSDDQVLPTTTDERLLDSRGPSDWVHTDPWRVLRIQSEFVEGSARWPSWARRSACSARPAPSATTTATAPRSRSGAGWPGPGSP